MKNLNFKITSLILILTLVLTMTVGCNEDGKSSTTKEEAYNIYYNTIKKFVPELMTEPQECSIDIKTRDEVTYLTEHFVRNTYTEINSQNVEGKLQYYLLDRFPEANKMSFYFINDTKFYVSSSFELNKKGKLLEYNASLFNSAVFVYLNTPLFKKEAIRSFTSKKKDSNTAITFVIDGADMEYGYSQRVMKEINPSLEDKLDDVKIVLTIDKNNVPKTMSTEISMSIFNDKGDLRAEKTLTMDFVFNKLDNVEFDLQDIISQYALNASFVK